MGTIEGVGWQLASFVADALEPSQGQQITSTDVWRAYCDWCRGRHRIPMAESIFAECFLELSKTIGLSEHWRGGNVCFSDVQIKEGQGG